jgi:hypothetical protein
MPKVIGFNPVDLGYGGMKNYSGSDNNKILDDVKDGDYPLAPTGDPYWSDVVLLLGSSGFTDLSGTTTITASNATVSATGGKWSGYINNSAANAYFDTGTQAIMAIGTKDFTIEFWAKNTDNIAGGTLHNQILTQFYNGTNPAYLFGFWTVSGYQRLNFEAPGVSVGGANAAISADNVNMGGVGSGVVLNQWHHYALTRQSGTVRAYFDGVRIIEQSGSTSIPNDRYRFGNWTVNGDRHFRGHFSDVRVTDSIARYTGSTLPVPTAAYPIA